MSNFITCGYPYTHVQGDPLSLCLRQTHNTHIPQNPMRKGNWNGQKVLQLSSIPSSLSSFHFWPLSFFLYLFLFTYNPPPRPSSQATIAAFTLQASDPSKADLIFPWTVNIIPSPSLASSDNCSFGKSTSKVIIKEPLMLLLSKLGSPSPFFHSLAPGLVILSREICTWKAKGDAREGLYSRSTTQLLVSTDWYPELMSQLSRASGWRGKQNMSPWLQRTEVTSTSATRRL